jgi:signal transduction histidine kinase
LTGRHRSLERDLILPAVVLGLLAVAGLGYTALEFAREAEQLGREVRSIRTANDLLYDVNRRSAEVDRAVLALRVLHGRSSGDLEAIEQENARAMSEIAVLDLGPRGTRLREELALVRAAQHRAQEDLLKATLGGQEDGVQRAFVQWDFAANRAAALLADLSGLLVRRLDSTVADFEARRAKAFATFIAALVAGPAAVALLAIRVRRRFLTPLLAMTAAAERIARERVIVQVRGADRRDELGTLAAAFNQMTDDLVHANGRLAGALRIRDEFLSIASHELKTPLTALQLQLQLAAREAAAAGRAEPRWLTGAQRQVKRLDTLVSQLLDVTRIRADRLPLERRDVDLGELVAGVVDRFSGELERAGTRLDLSASPGVAGHWDPDRLDQVVTNLLSNAVKYGGGSPVSIAVADAGDRAILTVEDRGPGIPPESRALVFEPFERAADSRAVGGLGLGLFIARQIARAHGGDVRMEDMPHPGARFVVELPRARPIAPAHAARYAGGSPRT